MKPTPSAFSAQNALAAYFASLSSLPPSRLSTAPYRDGSLPSSNNTTERRDNPWRAHGGRWAVTSIFFPAGSRSRWRAEKEGATHGCQVVARRGGVRVSVVVNWALKSTEPWSTGGREPTATGAAPPLPPPPPSLFLPPALVASWRGMARGNPPPRGLPPGRLYLFLTPATREWKRDRW